MSILRGLLPYFEVGVAILFIITVLMQQKGTGLSSAFGGEGNIYRTKRGLERILFISTIILATLFLLLAFLILLIK